MQLTSELELQEKSSAKLKITIPENEIKKVYDEIVIEYCKTLHIKGFRKGKVPSDVLIRKFGDALKDETAQRIVEKSLEEALEKAEHQPLPYSTPTMVDKESKFELNQDFSYEIIYDIFPKVVLGEYTGYELEETEVEVTDEDLETELKNLQEQNSVVAEKKNPIVEKNDIVTLDYVELDDENNEKEGTKRESFTFTVGTGYNLFQFDDDIEGLKKDEEKILEKEYPEDYKYPSLAGKKVKLKVKIGVVKEKSLPVLDDELAQDISDKYSTLEDLKTDIRSKLRLTADEKIREQNSAQLIEKIVSASSMEIPESMIKQELDMRWHSMLYQYRTTEKQLLAELEKENKTKDDLFVDWRQSAVESIKSSIVIEEIAKKENIVVAEDEIEEEIKKFAESQKMAIEDMRNTLKANKMLDNINLNIRNQKLFTYLLKHSKIKVGKKLKYSEFIQERSQKE